MSFRRAISSSNQRTSIIQVSEVCQHMTCCDLILVTGTNDWDSSEKCRCPAWCDRVLWRGPGVSLLTYTATDKLMVSDHKPVSAAFHVDIRVIDREKRQKLKEDIMKKLDSLENEFLPQVRIVTLTVAILADHDCYSFEGDGGWDWVWQYSQF